MSDTIITIMVVTVVFLTIIATVTVDIWNEIKRIEKIQDENYKIIVKLIKYLGIEYKEEKGFKKITK